MVTEINATRPVARPEGIGLDLSDRRELLDATGAVGDADVSALLDREGVDGDTVEIPQNPAFDNIRDGTHVLMRGHTGDTVRAAQEHLIELGILDPESDPLQQADGIFGAQTEAAVRRFQEQQGLEKIDGIIGEETIGALEAAAAERAARRPDIPTTLEEREEARVEIVTDIADSLGVVEPGADGPGVELTPEAPAPDIADAPVAPVLDPNAVAPADTALDSLQAAIRPGDPHVEPAVLEAVGGPDGLAAGIDNVLDAELVPERYDDAMELVEHELVTPDPAPDAPVDPARIEDYQATLRTTRYLAQTTFGGASPEVKGNLDTLLVNASDAELDALFAADPNLVRETVGALARFDPAYASTVGRYFGIEE